MVTEKKFNIRVYGLYINNENKLLLSDEYFGGKFLTKFPGGGLEFGEGLIDAVKREWKEELDLEIQVLEHFHTTDFFQTSIFNESHQIISVYYMVEPLEFNKIKISHKPFDFDIIEEGKQAFRLVSLFDLKEDEITLPTDKKVISMLKEKLIK